MRWQRWAAGCVVVAGLAVGAWAAGPASQPGGDAASAQPADWPQLAGPLGTFAVPGPALPLVPDLSQAVQVWESPCKDLGRAKGSSQAYRRVEQFTAENIAKMGSHPGSWSGPIVADGLVYCASWRPVGPWAEVQGHKVRLDAEDLVVALDAQTGQTRWLTSEPGGILRGGGKRQGFQVGPVYHMGVVYSLGSTARLFAHDAATGQRKWVSDVHPARATQQAARDKALAALADGQWPGYDLTPDWCASLAVVGDTLIVPDNKGGLLGVDLATGARKWAAAGVTSRWATPSAWRHDGREDLLVANEKGELRLMDPATGTEHWKLSGLGPNWATLAPGRTHVLVNVVPNSGKAKDAERVAGRYGAIKLSATSGEKAWEAPPDHVIPVWMDTGARTRVLYSDGRFLLPQWGLEASAAAAANGESPTSAPASAPAGKIVTAAYVLDEATGRVLATLPPITDDDERLAGVIYWWGDWLISRSDSFHGPAHGGRHPWLHWSLADGAVTRLPGKMDLSSFTNGYEVAMEVPLVDGRMYERTEAGSVVCYDLRARPASAPGGR